MATITELAHQLGAELAKDENVKKLQSAAQKQETDLELQKALMEFENLRNELITKSGEGDNEAAEKLTNELTAMQTKILEMDSMKEFYTARDSVDALMNEIYGILNFYITGEEPHSCGGNCSSCGGCH
ncbi:MAG: YlbF family regulator [Clostridia bacterium]|nr:YlbF family regulator [Clostridia bacterium]MBR3869901.1 YlbF family regulator [Clostridia bacterium]